MINKLETMRIKYKDGRVCPVCLLRLNIEEFHFSPDKPFRSQCNACNKLISTVASIHRKQKKDITYCDTRIKHYKIQIKLLEIIKDNNNATDVQITKIINGVQTFFS